MATRGSGRPPGRGRGRGRGRGQFAPANFTNVGFTYDETLPTLEANASSFTASSTPEGTLSARNTPSIFFKSSNAYLRTPNTASPAHSQSRQGQDSHVARSVASDSATSRQPSPANVHLGIGAASTASNGASTTKPTMALSGFMKASKPLAATFGQPALATLPSTLTSPASAVDIAAQEPASAEPQVGFQTGRVAHEQGAPGSRIQDTPSTAATQDGHAEQSSTTAKHASHFHSNTLPSEMEKISLDSSETSHMEPLFFLDTDRDHQNRTPTSPVKDTPSISTEDVEEQSDTEEMHYPSIHRFSASQLGPAKTSASSDMEHRSMSYGSLSLNEVNRTSTYARVVDDPVEQPQALPKPLKLDEEAKELLRDLTAETSPRRESAVSRRAQKKREKQAVKSRKRDRKKGRTILTISSHGNQPLELADSDDVSFGDTSMASKFDSSKDIELLKHRRSAKKATKDLERDLILEDYMENTKDSDDSIAGEDSMAQLRFMESFLRASKSEHLNADDLADLAMIEAEEEGSLDGDGIVEAEDSRKPPRSKAGPSRGRVAAVEESSGSRSEEDSSSESEEDEISDIIDSTTFFAPGQRFADSFDDSLDIDDLDEHMQQQWQKDRAKKALKRQERFLKRLEAQPTKVNRKKARRAGLPIGVQFDEPSGASQPPFHQINKEVRDFIENTSKAELSLPPMDKKYRYAIHMLAEAYNLKSKSRGSGMLRHNVLHRTMHTTVSGANMHKVHRYLSISATWQSGRPNDKYNKEKPRTSNRGGPAPRNNEGTAVGEGAERIAADNVGHRMLANMGWSVGEQIGKGGGLADPIAAIVKTSRAGLGSGYVRYGRGTATPGQSD